MTFLNPYLTLSKIKAQRAMTLIELLIIIAILGVFSSMANTWYTGYIETARVTNAISQISALSLLIADYQLENGEPPSSLSDVDNQNLIDPWGRPYEYLKINLQDHGSYSGGAGGGNSSDDEDEDDSPGGSAKGKARKDRNLVPLNTDFDLYSKGNDGNSRAPLSAPVSQDDILRANNGGFVGLASTF